jgi:hypothetical protein
MNSKWEHFRDELRIIPGLAKALAFVAFVGMQIVFAALSRTPNKMPPFPAWLLLGLLAGAALAAWVLVIGYINADSGRRGMGRVLWTFLAILVPNCLGILLYFLLRKPYLRQCGGCAGMVDPNFQFCPRCGCAMSPVCPNCGRGISHDFICCPYCGKPIKAAAAPTAPSVQSS